MKKYKHVGKEDGIECWEKNREIRERGKRDSECYWKGFEDAKKQLK